MTGKAYTVLRQSREMKMKGG